MRSNPETGTAFGNLESFPFTGASFAPAGSGNSVFCFSSSVISTAAAGGTQSQGFVFNTGGESLGQTSVTGSGVYDVSGGMPALFGPSASSPSMGNLHVFGSAAGAAGQVFASHFNSNLVNSSNDAPGLFSFGASSSAPSAAGSSTGPINGMAPVAFAFGASSATPASKTGASVTSSSASPGIFSFGGSSSPSSSNAINIFSSISTPGMFNFGGNSSSSRTNAVHTSAATDMFNFCGSSSASPTFAVKTSSSATPGIFSFGCSSLASLTNARSTVNSAFTFGATSASPQTSTTAGTFGSSWQSSISPGFGSPFSSSTPSGFTFVASSSSSATPSTSAVVFGSTPTASGGSAFLFGSTSLTNLFSQLELGNCTPPFAVSSGNNTMEDSMDVDPVQASGPLVSFGQPSVSPSAGGFVFGSTPSPFQFSGQQSLDAAQNPSPFAGLSSIGSGGSFSLGSNGPDKSGRKIVSLSKSNQKKRK